MIFFVMKRMVFGKYKKLIIIFGGIIFLTSISLGILFYLRQKSSGDLVVSDPVVQKLGNFAELPDQDPQIAPIPHVSKLAKQAFFDKAANGDKIIIFKEAHKAYLFRPDQNKIINITTFNITEVSSENP